MSSKCEHIFSPHSGGDMKCVKCSQIMRFDPISKSWVVVK